MCNGGDGQGLYRTAASFFRETNLLIHEHRRQTFRQYRELFPAGSPPVPARLLKFPAKEWISLSTFIKVIREVWSMAHFVLDVNSKKATVEAEADLPLLWVLRDLLDLTGTKYGCGVGMCGACTVHLDGTAVRSCQIPVLSTLGKQVTTIEGLGQATPHAVQRAWITEQVPQCGYCQPGQIMSAAALLATNTKPADSDIDEAMAGNLCRCGTYARMRNAIHRAAKEMHP